MCLFPSTVADAEMGSHLGLDKSSEKVGSSDTEAVSVFVAGTGIKLLKTLQTVIFFPPLLSPEELQMDATVIAH